MKKLLPLLFLSLLWSPAGAQQMQGQPAQVANGAAYNSATQTCVSGFPCWLQVDVNGNLKIVLSGTPASALQVQGDVASAATDSGNPVKIGGQVQNTISGNAFVDGTRQNALFTTRGALQTSLTGASGGVGVISLADNADGVAVTAGQSGLKAATRNSVFNGTSWDRMYGGVAGLLVNPQALATGGATYAHVAAGQATTVIKGSAGTLYSICLNGAATATNTTNFYDNASTSGTVIATIAATTATVPTCLQYGPVGLNFAIGLTVITATANGADMTISFK